MNGRDWRPRPGNQLIGYWPTDDPPPPGWERRRTPWVVWRVADGTAADNAVDVIGYTEHPNCGQAA